MNTRGFTAVCNLLLAALLLAAGAPRADQDPPPDGGAQTADSYQSYIDAVRAQRQAQLSERHRKMREAADNRRQLGEARRQAMSERAWRYPPPPAAEDQQDQWPANAMPPYWDNAWYYRGY